ncbi:cytochrome [Mycolicibacter minnesotensis]|uniref:Cytochrome n=1 Tax=Mycolicibacter minnesotensis TaxID=1118379 RepID=A0A7I7R2U6_9MYCO|nr:cytochrome P450 [Mycolicibacter minnesotensis]ORA99402.1 cytochrome [Mycolicibacter minnesotensis]BBY32983.1 cytochrome P450 [Mycolicibacter minnesotensis]
MSTPTIDQAARVFVDPRAYADEPRLHAALTQLRAHRPVSRVDQRPYRPFWAITRHADITAIERDNRLWINAPRPLLAPAYADDMQRSLVDSGMGLRTLIHMDDPQHQKMRAVISEWFRPKAMRSLQERIDELAQRYVEKMAQRGPECDFVQEIAVNYPLYVIMSLLGLPESDFPRMLRLTQELFGGDDEEYRRGLTAEEQLPVLLDFFGYFGALTAARRAQPTHDLASTIANATIDGAPLSDVDTASYYVIIATAGHDTTSAAISGGMRALIEHPDQRGRLRAEPTLMPSAVEEIIRWVTPVKEFMRTATADTQVHGVPIAAGESVYLSYVSANRDESVFAEPFVFDVGRDPNRHLAFGHGVHFCVGAALARMEISSFFHALLPRLEAIELAGEPQLASTTFVGGLKHLPIRYRLRP